MSANGARYSLMGRPGPVNSVQRRGQLGQDLKEVADKAVVGDLEDRRLGILVDRDDHFAVLHPGQMLDRPGNADGDVKVGGHDLAGLPDLIVVGYVARIDGRARGSDRRVELVRERIEQLEVLGVAEATTAGDDDARTRELRPIRFADLL